MFHFVLLTIDELRFLSLRRYRLLYPFASFTKFWSHELQTFHDHVPCMYYYFATTSEVLPFNSSPSFIVHCGLASVMTHSACVDTPFVFLFFCPLFNKSQSMDNPLPLVQVYRPSSLCLLLCLLPQSPSH